jgi:hypothetical protein
MLWYIEIKWQQFDLSNNYVAGTSGCMVLDCTDTGIINLKLSWGLFFFVCCIMMVLHTV